MKGFQVQLMQAVQRDPASIEQHQMQERNLTLSNLQMVLAQSQGPA